MCSLRVSVKEEVRLRIGYLEVFILLKDGLLSSIYISYVDGVHDPDRLYIELNSLEVIDDEEVDLLVNFLLDAIESLVRSCSHVSMELVTIVKEVRRY